MTLLLLWQQRNLLSRENSNQLYLVRNTLHFPSSCYPLHCRLTKFLYLPRQRHSYTCALYSTLKWLLHAKCFVSCRWCCCFTPLRMIHYPWKSCQHLTVLSIKSMTLGTVRNCYVYSEKQSKKLRHTICIQTRKCRSCSLEPKQPPYRNIVMVPVQTKTVSLGMIILLLKRQTPRSLYYLRTWQEQQDLELLFVPDRWGIVTGVNDVSFALIVSVGAGHHVLKRGKIPWLLLANGHVVIKLWYAFGNISRLDLKVYRWKRLEEID